MNIWKVKIWLSQERKELLKWNKKKFSLFQKCFLLDIQRWVENKTVATRLKKIWNDLVKLSFFWNSLPKSKRPSSKNYHTLKAALDDKQMPAKLQFFEHIAPIIESYLKRYQTDKPMVPFMYYDLKDIVYVSVVGDHCFRLF